MYYFSTNKRHTELIYYLSDHLGSTGLFYLPDYPGVIFYFSDDAAALYYFPANMITQYLYLPDHVYPNK